tara:strand:+ start:42712 stop:43305 length:594 start_codon:yes stop_codon:yes gene_type:complete
MVRGRPRKIDPEKALEAAMKTFWDKGYDATSLSDLVAATGMAKPGLYATFGDKQEIYTKSLENYVRLHGMPLMGRLMQSEKPAKEAFRDLFIAMVDSFFDENTPDGCFLANSLVKSKNNEPSISALANSIQQFRKGKFRDYLDLAQEKGLLAPENDSEKLADYFSAQAITLPVMHKTGASKENLHMFIETVITIIRD